MEIEIYRKKESLENNPIESVDKDVERMELYKSLGFKGLASLSTRPYLPIMQRILHGKTVGQ